MDKPTSLDRSFDVHVLVGAASHFISRLADQPDPILSGMARDWLAAYRRYDAGQRAELRYSDIKVGG